MEDIEKMLAIDNANKKKTSTGYYKKVRCGGRHVRMPSDYLTKGEIKKMSSPVTTYNPTTPYKWDEFKRFPDRIQVAYWDMVNRNYDTNAHQMAKMFGVSDYTVKVWMKAHGIEPKHRGYYIDPKERDRWEEFLKSRNSTGNTDPKLTPKEDPKRAEPEKTAEIPVEAPIESVPPVSVADEKTPENFTSDTVIELSPNKGEKANIADIIASLIGTGAKLTIEVVL